MRPRNPITLFWQEWGALRKSVDELRVRIDDLAHRDFLILQAIHDDEPGTRQRLWELRDSPDYERPFLEENPLVTIYVTTYSNAEGLADRSLPSILGQTYDNLE